MAPKFVLITILYLIVITTVKSQIAEKLTVQNPCVSKPTCHECIQTPSCAWCFAPVFQGARCFQPSYPIPLSGQCPEEYTFNPDNLKQIILNKALSKAHSSIASGGGWEAGGSFQGSSSSSSSSSHGSFGGASGGFASGHGEIVQVQPQRISLKLRARQSYSIWMNYTQAVDYPVDLYYLMDLSKSMEDDKDKLSLLGDLLANTMRNITMNFRLGFGSFVDKVVMPYVSTVPKKLKMPCTNCEAPYGFRNHMQLSTNTSQFSQMVKEASVSGNLDAPEGGFDAIMQAIVCNEEIGWRSKARRLLVFSTDAGFHYAGDGKLGGIIKPNDGNCHLDTSGVYTHSTIQDYPSISQINLKVKKHAINVIFAVTADQKHVYTKLQENIEGSSSGTLSGDSSNIVELVKTQYEQISSQIQLSDNATKSYININYYTKCLNKTGVEKKTRKCENVKVGDLIEFRVEIEVIQCPRDPKDWNQVIKIYPVAINESLIIDLEMLCSCPCEKPGDAHYKENSEECSYNGIYKCGICECAPHRFGRICECSSNQTDPFNNTLGCRRDANATQDCSGRGSCSCGVCECFPRDKPGEEIYGDFCECDNFSCERHNGLLCSGPDHGICDCGKCDCNEEWTGSNCACKKSNASCYDSKTGLMCSGHGVCECGVCVCDVTDEGRYSGPVCEKCLTCADRCEEFKECVQCQMYKTGKLSEDECTQCPFTPTAVDVAVVKEENNENLCAYYDDDDCRFAYVYYFDSNDTIQVRAQEKRECPPKVFLLGIVLGVIAVIVLMGLAILLLWKLFTTIHDRREFAKFEKERMMAKWDTGENPIYKQATSTFKNPTYAGKS